MCPSLDGHSTLRRHAHGSATKSPTTSSVFQAYSLSYPLDGSLLSQHNFPLVFPLMMRLAGVLVTLHFHEHPVSDSIRAWFGLTSPRFFISWLSLWRDMAQFGLVSFRLYQHAFLHFRRRTIRDSGRMTMTRGEVFHFLFRREEFVQVVRE